LYLSDGLGRGLGSDLLGAHETAHRLLGSVAALCSLNVGMSRQIEHERDAPRATARAFEALGEHRNREGRAPRPDQRLEVKIVAGIALPDALHAFAAAEGASGSDAPTEGKGFAESFHHEDIKGTDCGETNNQFLPIAS
jgi:hypothetical protein